MLKRRKEDRRLRLAPPVYSDTWGSWVDSVSARGDTRLPFDSGSCLRLG